MRTAKGEETGEEYSPKGGGEIALNKWWCRKMWSRKW